MDILEQFSRVWCPTCNKTQPMIFDVMKANDKNDHDAADTAPNESKSVMPTQHGPTAHRAVGRTGRAEKARAMAGQEIDSRIDLRTSGDKRRSLAPGNPERSGSRGW